MSSRYLTGLVSDVLELLDKTQRVAVGVVEDESLAPISPTAISKYVRAQVLVSMPCRIDM